MRKLLVGVPIVAALIAFAAMGAGANGSDPTTTHRVKIPESDRFTPFALTIHTGDFVRWTNNDEDAHTVVSDPPFDTAGHKAFDQIIRKDGGHLRLQFNRPGSFVYYCRFHSHLNKFNQPVAPGPDGGVQSPSGNFGTPMSGVITVLPND